MIISRRDFVGLAGGAMAAGMIASSPFARAAEAKRITCVAFDAFPILDPRPIAALAEQIFPDNGRELVNQWRTRQFEYTWLRSVANRYVDFRQVTADSLTFAARALKVDLPDAKRQPLLDAYLKLQAYPDVLPALQSLRDAGYRLAFLSNFTVEMLQAGIRNSGLNGFFEHVLSTDAVKAFKPAPAAYRMAVDAFRVPQEEILFVPFAGWDAAGAKWFGYKTFWANRQKFPPEELDATPDAVGENLTDLVTYLKSA